MKLLKKIFILVNLILCFFCVKCFAYGESGPSISWLRTNHNNFFESFPSLYLQYIDNYPYVYGYYYDSGASSSSGLIFYFSSQPFFEQDGNYNNKVVITASSSCFSTVPSSVSTAPLNVRAFFYKYGTDAWENYNTINNGRYASINACSTQKTIYSNFNIYQHTGSTSYNSLCATSTLFVPGTVDKYNLMSLIPSFDDTTIDWDDAFEYYWTPSYADDSSGIEHSKKVYDNSLFLCTVGNSLDGVLHPSNTSNFGYYYTLCYDLEFVFTGSNGDVSRRSIKHIQNFNDKWESFEVPYLVTDMADDEQYTMFGVFLDCFSAPFDYLLSGGNLNFANYPDYYAWLDDVVEHFLDDYGYFNYDLLFKPYVYKYDIQNGTGEIIYTYDIVSLIYDVNSPYYPEPGEDDNVTTPFDVPDIGYIHLPDGTTVPFDTNPDYHFDNDGDIADGNGDKKYVHGTDDDGNDTWTDTDTGDVDVDKRGSNRKNSDDITNETIKDKNYDISSIINSLKSDVRGLLTNNSSFTKISTIFQDVFDWLPFNVFKIFLVVISFYIIFEFIKIMRS